MRAARRRPMTAHGRPKGRFSRLLGRKRRAGDAGHRQAPLTPAKRREKRPFGRPWVAIGRRRAALVMGPHHVEPRSKCPVSEIRTLYDGLARFPARSAARRDAGASQAARNDVRGPRKTALRVAFPASSGRREHLTMAPHRRRVPSCRGNGKNDRIVHESLRKHTWSVVRRDGDPSREPRDDVRWPPMAARRVAFRAFWGRQRRLTMSSIACATLPTQKTGKDDHTCHPIVIEGTSHGARHGLNTTGERRGTPACAKPELRFGEGRSRSFASAKAGRRRQAAARDGGTRR